MDWCRLHHGVSTDPKWRLIAKKASVRAGDVLAVWTYMLDHASQANPRGTLSGWDDEVCAIALDFEPEQVASIRRYMMGRVLEDLRLTGWDKRQPKREDETAAERKRAQRERDKNGSGLDGGPSRDVTHSHAASRDVTIDKNRTEKRVEVLTPPPTNNVSSARAPEGAAAVVAKFLELREAGWPNDSRMPAPTMTIRQQAQQHIDAGGSVELISEVLERGFQTWRHPTPPKSLEAFRDSLTDRIAEFKRAGEAPEPRAQRRDGQPGPVASVIVADPWARERVRLQAFRRSGRWDYSDPPPGHPRCQIPRNVLEQELGSEWLERHATEAA